MYEKGTATNDECPEICWLNRQDITVSPLLFTCVLRILDMFPLAPLVIEASVYYAAAHCVTPTSNMAKPHPVGFENFHSTNILNDVWLLNEILFPLERQVDMSEILIHEAFSLATESCPDVSRVFLERVLGTSYHNNQPFYYKHSTCATFVTTKKFNIENANEYFFSPSLYCAMEKVIRLVSAFRENRFRPWRLFICRVDYTIICRLRKWSQRVNTVEPPLADTSRKWIPVWVPGHFFKKTLYQQPPINGHLP